MFKSKTFAIHRVHCMEGCVANDFEKDLSSQVQVLKAELPGI